MSNETKHTPGPWRIEPGQPGLISASRNAGRIETPFDVRAIASIRATGSKFLSQNRQTEEDKANARLIAAAPELLEALIQILRINDHEDYTYDQREEMIQQLAQSAIAKAEGRVD